ncbi:MAG: hypothetical protein WBA97_01355 [Actinophytocola sp.]|uniref:hypothetical protein n=1 Tax=Actinophytocola sp. TaxID=1872138 RepID=UPI003C76F2AE
MGNGVTSAQGTLSRTTGTALAAPVLAGLAAWTFLPEVGRISLTEIAALLLAPCCLVALVRLPRGGALVVFAVLWLVGITLGQLTHPADTTTVVKAVSSAVMLVLTVGLVVAVLRHGSPGGLDLARHRLVVAFAVGQLIGMALTPPAVAVLDPWKFGIGQAVTLLVLVLTERAWRNARRVVVPVVLVGMAGVHLVLGSRSLCLLALIIALAAVVTWLGGTRPSARIVVFGLFAVVGAVLLDGFYVDLAGSGTLGDAATQKLRFQDGELGVAVGGRKDFVFVLFGALHSPWVGWGPAAVVPPEVKSAAVHWLVDHGYPIYGYDLMTFVMPESLFVHSVVLGGWVTAGVAALPFWVLVIVFLVRGFADAVRRGAFAEAFLVLTALWHVFFSRLGDTTRGHIAVAVALAIIGLAARDAVREQGGDEDTDNPVPDGGSDGGLRRCGGAEACGAEPEQHPGRQDDGDRQLVPCGLQPQYQQLRQQHARGGDQVAAHGGQRGDEHRTRQGR